MKRPQLSETNGTITPGALGLGDPSSSRTFPVELYDIFVNLTKNNIISFTNELITNFIHFSALTGSIGEILRIPFVDKFVAEIRLI